VRDSRYHGSFDHPVRAFLIGVTLLVLLFGGFVIGTEAGTHPIEQTGAATVRVVTTKGRVQTVTVGLPVARTVINGRTRVVRLPGSVRRQLVVIHRGGKTIYAYGAIEPAPSGDSGVATSAATVYAPAPVTVTTPPETVTAPPETVTVTVTEPPPSSTDSSGTTQTGP
jgi:hypothetical protein